MIALYRSGRQAEALQAYQDARLLLSDELGIDPGPDLRRTEQQVLTHDRALAWTAPPGTLAAPADETHLLAAEKSAPKTSVPVPRSPILGRDDELRSLTERQSRSRIDTITGPGGAGKSRLALELAHRSSIAARWIDLSSIGSNSDVPVAVAAALAIATAPGVSTVEALRAAPPADPVLLVLDTCEHVIEGAAQVANLVLEEWPHARVLATRQWPGDLAGEVEPAAIELPAEEDREILPVAAGQPSSGPSSARTASTRRGGVPPGRRNSSSCSPPTEALSISTRSTRRPIAQARATGGRLTSHALSSSTEISLVWRLEARVPDVPDTMPLLDPARP